VQPVEVLLTVSVPEYVVVVAVPGIVITIGVAGNDALDTLVNPAVIAAAFHVMLY
jgi:hypothetical protein